MRDQAALGIDHERLAVLADLDRGDHVPEQLEADLGHAYTRVAPPARERERHVGLGLAPEVDRPVIDAPRHRLGEFWVLGTIAGHQGLLEKALRRNTRLLLTRGIELAELRDRRHLAQKAPANGAPQVNC